VSCSDHALARAKSTRAQGRLLGFDVSLDRMRRRIRWRRQKPSRARIIASGPGIAKRTGWGVCNSLTIGSIEGGLRCPAGGKLLFQRAPPVESRLPDHPVVQSRNLPLARSPKMRRVLRLLTFPIATVLFLSMCDNAQSGATQDWNQYRGPNTRISESPAGCASGRTRVPELRGRRRSELDSPRWQYWR
jgi:hypothetical protein